MEQERLHNQACEPDDDGKEIEFGTLTGKEITVLPRECTEVQAVCRRVKLVRFRGMNAKLVFSFEILEPEQHRGVWIPMYVRWSDSWSKPPVSSKLYSLLVIAGGGQIPRGRFSSKIFKGRLFRCKVERSDGKVSYSYIKTITQ